MLRCLFGSLLTACLFTLGGCSNSSPQDQAISWAGAPKPIEEMVEGYIRSAQKRGERRLFDSRYYTPPTPYFTYQGNDDAATVALSARVPSSLSPIDVFYTDLYWFQNFEPSWLTSLEDVTIYVGDQKRTLREMVHRDLRRTCELSRTLYAAPLSIKGNCLYYRADLIEKPPETWQELTTICRQILSKQPRHSSLRYGLTFHWQELHTDMYPVMWGFGGGPPVCLDATTKTASPKLASESNLNALATIWEMIHVSRLTESAEQMDARRLQPEKELFRSFVEGRTLFLIDWSNRAARMHEALLEIASATGKSPFSPDEIGLAPIPHSTDVDHSYSTNGSWGWVLASNPRSGRSIDFIRDLCSPEAQLYFFEKHAEVPIYREEELKTLPGWPRTKSRLSTYHQQLIELTFGAGGRPQVEFRDRPSLKQVNRIIEDALHRVLARRPRDGSSFPRDYALSQLTRADAEITLFLRRIEDLGIDCSCPPAPVEETKAAPSDEAEKNKAPEEPASTIEKP